MTNHTNQNQTISPTGVSKDKLQRAAQLIDKAIADGLLPGATLLVARHGNISYFEPFGKADEHRPLEQDTLFRIASISKPILAVAVMQLFDHGDILLTDPIAEYLPEVRHLRVAEMDSKGQIRLIPPHNEITIHHLLTMTAGFVDPNDNIQAMKPQAGYVIRKMKDAGIADGIFSPNKTLMEHVREICLLPVAYQPGEAFNYSNVSAAILGAMIENVSGLPYDEYLKQNIFSPLEMNNCCFYPGPEQQNRLTALYLAHDTGNGSIGDPMVKEEHIAEDGYDHFDPDFGCGEFKSFLHVGGGLHSTVQDIFRFAQMLLNGGTLDGQRILSQEAVNIITTNQIGGLVNSISGNKWGYMVDIQEGTAPVGFNNGGKGAYGWEGIYGTKFWVNPAYETVIVFMTHVWYSYDIHPLQQRIVQVVNRSIVD